MLFVWQHFKRWKIVYIGKKQHLRGTIPQQQKNFKKCLFCSSHQIVTGDIVIITTILNKNCHSLAVPIHSFQCYMENLHWAFRKRFKIGNNNIFIDAKVEFSFEKFATTIALKNNHWSLGKSHAKLNHNGKILSKHSNWANGSSFHLTLAELFPHLIFALHSNWVSNSYTNCIVSTKTYIVTSHVAICLWPNWKRHCYSVSRSHSRLWPHDCTQLFWIS